MTGAASSVSLEVPSIEVEPQLRASITDTLDRLHMNGQGLDWSLQNRFKQLINGVTCDVDDDVVHTWVCSAAGDIFGQQMNVNNPRENPVALQSFHWLPHWTSAVKEIEQKVVEVVATELYSSCDIMESM